MRCERFTKLIYLLLDGRLNQSEEEKLKEHLSQCERCQKKLTLLESVEGRAKKIGIEEPSQQYWETFANRVSEKIFVRKEKSPVVRLRKALENIFTFSPLKVKVAAGVISVVLIFIVGKLYVDYRGQEILPSKTVLKTQEQPRLDITETEKKEGVPTEEGIKRVKSASDKPEQEMKPAIVEEAKEKAFPPEKPVDKEEGLLKEKEVSTPLKVSEEKAVPAPAPAIPEPTPIESEASLEQPVKPPEKKPTGAGAEEGAGKKMAVKRDADKEKAQKAEEVPSKGEAEQLLTKDINLPPPSRGFRPYSTDDTLMQVNELRRTIQVWKAYIEENPTDSLSNVGYLQVAMSYYLLAKLTQDTTLISEGSNIIEEYLDQIKDPSLKENLTDRLKEIKALRQR